MSYGTLSRDGWVARVERFEAPYWAMVHDFIVTERHVLFPVLPLIGDLPGAMQGGPTFVWEPEVGAHIGLIDRTRGVASLRWFPGDAALSFMC
ncbi:MAG: carotenoid oxygenase family protein [Acetobacteraceae bacterium]|nr:carotenoid oxygenase family protein [Acetobacteraceae bacterium]